MCHPGYVDDELEQTGTRLLAEREIEVFALRSRPVRRLVESSGIRLVNYKVLALVPHSSGAAA